MSLANCWIVSRGVDRALAAAALCASILAQAQTTPQVQFVKVLASPGAYAAPTYFGPGESVGVKISPALPRAEIQLRVYALVNRTAGHPYEKNESVPVAILGRADINRYNVGRNGEELVVPLAAVDKQNTLELTAWLVKGDVQVGNTARLTMDPAASVQGGPALLQQAMARGSVLMDRLMNIYQIVRDSPEPRFVYAASLAGGKPLSAPVRLPLKRSQFHALAVSPDGKRFAWVVEDAGQSILWTSDIDSIDPAKVASSEGEIASPLFADNDSLLYIVNGSVFIAQTGKSPAARPIRLRLQSVKRLDRAAMNEGRIECIVSATTADSPELALPYLVRISLPDLDAQAFRLPANPYYESYRLLVAGSPFFYAGSKEGVEGIHYFQPDDPEGTVNTLMKIDSAGLVALSADGSRVLFVGAP